MTAHLYWRTGETVCTYEIKHDVGVSRDVVCLYNLTFLYAGPGSHRMKPRELNNFFQGGHAFLNIDRLLE